MTDVSMLDLMQQAMSRIPEGPRYMLMSRNLGRQMGKRHMSWRKMFPAPKRHTKPVHRAYRKLANG